MSPLTSRLTSKGQTTIPLEVRKRLHLKEGDLLFYEISPDNVVRFRKLEKIDVQWAHAIEPTLSEWLGHDDDDL